MKKGFVAVDDLNIYIHYLDRNHGWSTTKFKNLIAKTI